MPEGNPAYLFARVTRDGSSFYPGLHPMAEARLERSIQALWTALRELSEVLGGGPAGFTLETGSAILSGYSSEEAIIVVASPKRWRSEPQSVGANSSGVDEALEAT